MTRLIIKILVQRQNEADASLVSIFLSHRLNYYLDNKAGPQACFNVLQPEIEFISLESFFNIGTTEAAADSLSGPENIQKLSGSPFLMDYFCSSTRPTFFYKFLSNATYEMILSSCSKRARICGRNFLLSKHYSRKEKISYSLL